MLKALAAAKSPSYYTLAPWGYRPFISANFPTPAWPIQYFTNGEEQPVERLLVAGYWAGAWMPCAGRQRQRCTCARLRGGVSPLPSSLADVNPGPLLIPPRLGPLRSNGAERVVRHAELQGHRHRDVPPAHPAEAPGHRRCQGGLPAGGEWKGRLGRLFRGYAFAKREQHGK